MRIRSLLILAVSTLAFAGKPQGDLPVTTYLSDYNSANAAYYVQNDDGTEYLAMHMENQCSEDNNDMYTMKPGQTFACSTLFRLPNITSTSFYRLDMCGNKCVYSEPETQKVQVMCNSSGNDGNCNDWFNDWFIDPIPVVNADGSTSPGQTVARLNLINTRPSWNYTGRK